MFCRSLRKNLMTIALLVALPSAGASAGLVEVWWQMNDEDGTHGIVEWEEEDGSHTWWYVLRDNEGSVWWQEIPAGNPNPEDGTTPGDWDMLFDLLKQHGGGGLQGPSLEQTPLGKYLLGKGIGKGPLHNPADGDGNGGQSPSGINFHDPRDFIDQTWQGGGVGGAGFDPNGGPIGEQIGNLGRKGGQGSDDDDGDGAQPSDGGLWDDDMPGPPELVNPATRTGFVLVPPTNHNLSHNAVGRTSSTLDPTPIPWAAFGGGQVTISRPPTGAGLKPPR